MAEYIEREEYCNSICRCNKKLCNRESCTFWQAPAADVAPVQHGCWIDRIDTDTPMHECSVCGARVVKGFYEYENPNIYCYRCGARMDGDTHG